MKFLRHAEGLSRPPPLVVCAPVATPPVCRRTAAAPQGLPALPLKHEVAQARRGQAARHERLIVRALLQEPFPRQVAQQPPWWRELAKVALIIPALALAALVRPPAASAQIAWRFWQRQPAAQTQVHHASPWHESVASATASAGAERWQRVLDTTAMRTAAVVLSTFTMFYVFIASLYEPLPQADWRIKDFQRLAAEKQSLAQASAPQPARPSKQAPSAARKPFAQAIQGFAAAGRQGRSSIGLNAEEFSAQAKPLPPLQPATETVDIPASAAMSATDTVDIPASGAMAATDTVDIPASAAMSATDTVDIPASAAMSATDTLDIPASGAMSATGTVDIPATPSRVAPGLDTVDIPAEQTPPAVGLAQRVQRKAQEISSSNQVAGAPPTLSAKAAAEPPDVKGINAQPSVQTTGAERSSITFKGTAKNGRTALEQATADREAANTGLLRDMINNLKMSDEAVAEASDAIMREVAAEQEAAQPEPAPARASPKQGGPIGFILRSNPIGSFLNGLLNHQPTSNKYDMLWDLLHISRTEAGAVRDSKYDPVYEVLQSAAVESDWATPRSGPAYDLLHIGDTATSTGNGQGSGPSPVRRLLNVQASQLATPKHGLVHAILHLGDRVGASLGSIKDDFGQILPLRADPVGDFLNSAASAADWEDRQWDPLAQLFNGALSHGGVRSKYDPFWQVGGVQAHHPISRPSKYDPLAALLTSSAPTSRPALDPVAGILSLALATSRSRSESRAQRRSLQAVAVSRPAPEANGASVGSAASAESNGNNSNGTGNYSPPQEDSKGNGFLRGWHVRSPFGNGAKGSSDTRQRQVIGSPK